MDHRLLLHRLVRGRHGVEVGGLLTLLANQLVAATGGNMAAAGYAILWASAVPSSIVDKIPFVATMMPLIKSMVPAYGDPQNIEPLWWCLSLGACLGGNGTLIGASANLIVVGIGDRNGVPFSFVNTRYMHPDDARLDRDRPRVCVVAIFLNISHHEPFTVTAMNL